MIKIQCTVVSIARLDFSRELDSSIELVHDHLELLVLVIYYFLIVLQIN